jgi:hypothetical protein
VSFFNDKKNLKKFEKTEFMEFFQISLNLNFKAQALSGTGKPIYYD